MSTYAKIEFDYREAINQANKLDEIAGNIRRLASNSMENTLITLNGGWQGETADSFIRKGRELEEKTTKTAEDLKRAAERIRTIAKRVHDAEMAVLDIADKRSY